MRPRRGGRARAAHSPAHSAAQRSVAAHVDGSVALKSTVRMALITHCVLLHSGSESTAAASRREPSHAPPRG